MMEITLPANGAGLEFVMAAVAEDGIGGVLAAAEVEGFGFGGLEFGGGKGAVFVAAVAEGLGIAAAASAPVVAFAGFDFDGVRGFLGDGWRGHGELSLQRGRDIIADGGEVALAADGTASAELGFSRAAARSRMQYGSEYPVGQQ